MNVKRGIVSVSWDDHRELFKDLSQTQNKGQFVFVSPLKLHSIDLEVCDGFHQQLRGGGMRVRSNCSRPLHPRKTKPLSLDILLDILALAAEQDINKWHWRFFRTALFHFASGRSHHGRGRNPQETQKEREQSVVQLDTWFWSSSEILSICYTAGDATMGVSALIMS